jgi:hypothetical protein
MSKLLSFFLIVAILLHSMSSLVIVAGFQLNRNYISKNLCENRAKPKLHCNGKCHLMKELKKEDKTEKSNGSSSRENDFQSQYFQEKSAFDFTPHTTSSPSHAFYLISPVREFTGSVFHPPSFCC